MTEKTFIHSNRIEAAGQVVCDLVRRRTMLAGGAPSAQPALAGSPI